MCIIYTTTRDCCVSKIVALIALIVKVLCNMTKINNKNKRTKIICYINNITKKHIKAIKFYYIKNLELYNEKVFYKKLKKKYKKKS